MGAATVIRRRGLAILLAATGACTDAPRRESDGGTLPVADAALGPAPPPLASQPELVGTLVGPSARLSPEGLRVYGTDLGMTYEHDGEHFIVFGDTWPYADFSCDTKDPIRDDMLGTLPDDYPGGVPEISFVTKPGEPTEVSWIDLRRDGQSLTLGFGKVPMVVFSDGERAYGFFARLEPTRCDSATPGAARCPTDDGFVCSARLGLCEPPIGSIPLPCDAEANLGCIPPSQTCNVPESALCFDPGSSQNDGTAVGELSAIAEETEIAVQDPASPEVFDSVHVWPTSRFNNLTARAVARFSGKPGDNDYRPGHRALLVWGRPGFSSQGPREPRLYLMKHELPFALDASGKLSFAPSYFAGLDPETGEPIWSKRESHAEPLALDGVVGGSPVEQAQVVNQMSISWLGPPVKKWVMLYGGDLAGFLNAPLPDDGQKLPGGPILMRTADEAWGPWEPPEQQLSPGSPSVVGDPYGPGGFLYHSDCKDEPPALCARTDPTRPIDAAFPGCPKPTVQTDVGRLYGASIIDAYTQASGDDALEVLWNVSIWNPYSVLLMKTTLHAKRAAR